MYNEIDEIERLKTMCRFERPYWDKGFLVAGIDEAGRGPLAGPCVAAAVIMQPDNLILGVEDSKKLSEKKRQKLYQTIKTQALSYAVGIVDNRTVDKINILNAARRAFAKAFSALSIKPSYVFCDRICGIDIDTPYEEIVGGDRLCYSIAAASIIAKVTRDEIMRGYGSIYPEYGFAKHKGYATKEHRECIIKYGVCDIHRMSFLKKIIS
ncbi:MAG: ribonuclease HII [Christensenellales bacterium]